MKKSLVVVALAGAMAFTAASAETVLYGSIRLGAEVAKNHYNQDGVKNKRGLSMEDFGSRVGLKGSEDLGNGAKVLYQVEFGFDGMTGGKGFSNEMRLAWIGVQGEWGTIALGRQNNPFTESLNADTEADMFNGNYTSALRIATGNVVFGEGVAMPTRVGNSLAYVSPSFSGFNFVVAGITEIPNQNLSGPGAYYAAGNKSKGFDIYTVALNYEHESGFFAKGAYLGADMSKATKAANAYGLNVGFTNEQFGVNADFGGASQGRKGDTGTKTTSTSWDLGGHFSFGPDYFSTVRATVG
ncbi:MAG: porin, partial [Wohlfahrtiimonas sp.]